jgi:hypothetical protein
MEPLLLLEGGEVGKMVTYECLKSLNVFEPMHFHLFLKLQSVER